jgi:hypothetical protein
MRHAAICQQIQTLLGILNKFHGSLATLSATLNPGADLTLPDPVLDTLIHHHLAELTNGLKRLNEISAAVGDVHPE